jgi:hypothetical protein
MKTSVMKNFILISVFSLLIMNGYCQSFSQQLGAIPTQFEFTTSELPLDIIQQQIVKRAGRIHHSSAQASYAAGYETFRLEIQLQSDIPLMRAKLFDGNSGYQFTFFSESGERLGFVRLSSSEVNRIRDNRFIDSKVNFYSFDLINVPLLILDKTSRIDIERFIFD